MRFPRRALQQNDYGDEVVRLQQALHALGYDVGEIDGEFGYLTSDALRQFQREHKLRVDAKAGAQVRAMLYRPELTAMRRIHVAQAHERLIDIARDNGVTVEYLRRANRLPLRRPLYEGQRLFIRGRYVIGAARTLVDPRDAEFALRRSGRYLSAIGSLQFKLDTDGKIEAEWNPDVIAVCLEQNVQVLTVIHTWDEAGQPDQALGAVLRNRTKWRQVLKRISELAMVTGVSGIVLDGGGLRFGEGSRFVRFVSEMAQVIRKRSKALYVGVPVVKPGVKGTFAASDLDWQRLASVTDGLILQTHRRTEWAEGMPTIVQLDQSIRALCGRIPAWKAMLGVGLGGREYTEPTKQTRDVSYQRAMAMAYMRSLRPSRDEARGVLTTHYIATESENEKRTLWIENAHSIEMKLQWVERYNLKGLFLWPLGDEDSRVWQVVPQWISAWRHV